jgi:electron transfer flavoprotein alpha/beta subunit
VSAALRVVVLLARPLGPCDDAALRAGLALGPVAAISACDDDAPLRHALARGALRALKIADPSLEGLDYHGIARVLAAAARVAGFDLVLCGERSAGEAQGAVGPAVAEALNLPQLTAALDVRADDGALVVERRDDGGVRTLRVTPPLVITVTRSPASPALPPVEAGVETLALDAALGIGATELRHRARCAGRVAPRAGRAEIVSAADLARRLLDERSRW